MIEGIMKQLNKKSNHTNTGDLTHPSVEPASTDVTAIEMREFDDGAQHHARRFNEN